MKKHLLLSLALLAISSIAYAQAPLIDPTDGNVSHMMNPTPVQADSAPYSSPTMIVGQQVGGHDVLPLAR